MPEKAKVPALRFKGFTDDWEQHKIGEIGKTKSGNGFPENEQGGSYGVPFFKVSDMNNAGNEHEMKNSNNYVSQEQILRRNWKPIETVPAVIFAKVGAAIMLDRKRLVCSPFLIDNNTMAYVFDNSWDISFGKTLFDTISLPKYVQVGALPSYNGSDIEDINVWVPTIDEQKKIGDIFNQVDHLITLQQRKLLKLRNVKKAMLEKMFPQNGRRVPEIRFAGFTDDWEQRKIGEMGNTFTGLSGKTKEVFGHGDAKFVTYMNVFGNEISNPEGVESIEIDNKQNQVKYGDVFFTTSSETPEEVGMASVWLENTENVYLNSFCFGYRPTVEFDLFYLAFMLRSPEIRKKFMFLAQGISRYNISKNKVMEMNVPVPELNEQRKVGTFFRKLDDLITLQQRKCEKLQNLKKACLEKMFV